MNIVLNKELFLEKLNLSSKFCSSKLSSSLSLQGVLLIGEENKINFYSTNLNYYYHGYMNADFDKGFKIVVEPKKIIEFISLLSTGKIEMEINDKSIIITQGKTKGEFSLFTSDDFPLPSEKSAKKQKIKASLLKNTLPMLFFSASTDEARPVLSGINFVSNGEGTQIVTTDGFRLSLLNLKEQLPFSSMIIPSGFLSEIYKFLEEEDEVSFSFQEDDKMLSFYLGQNIFYTRLIDGEYPPYEKVIPAEKKTTITLDREEFLRSVKLISVFARDFSNIIILEADKDGLILSPKTGQNDSNSTFQEAEVKGDGQKIAFNLRFLIDFLSNIPSKRVIIELLRSDSPAVFKTDKHDGFLHIIMPVRIQE